MRIGTTPTHTFELPFEAEMIKDVEVVYAQKESIILEKNLGACNCNKNILTLKLTQEETFKFDPLLPIVIQLRVLTNDGEVISSDPIIRRPCDCLSSKVMK